MLKRRFFHSCLNTDNYEKRTFERLYGISGKLRDMEAEGETVFPGFRFINLLGDQWASLYKNDPQINPEAGGKALIHKPLVQRVMQSEEYETLRQSTTLDDFASAIGTLSLGENTIEYIRLKQQQDEELKKKLEQQNELQEQIRKNQNAIDKRDLQGKKPTKAQEEKKQSLEQQLQELQQQIGQKLAEGMNPKEMLKQAQQEAKETRDNMEDLLSGPQPGSGKGEMEKIPLRTQLELAHQLKQYPEVKKVAEWAGRFKTIARRKQKSKITDSVERQGIVQGANPELLLPTELSLLKNKATKLDFYRRFTEKQTLQYATKGKESTGKGPIVLCIDQSGSMTHSREEAAGFALAIAMIARSQKRDFAYVPFSGYIGEVLIFPKGKLDSNAILKIATEFIGGGTSFEAPLKEALRIIERKSRFKNADIVFITDGQSHISKSFENDYQQKKKNHKFQCMSCVIGFDSPGIKEVLKRFSDEIFIANDFLNAAKESRLFEI